MEMSGKAYALATSPQGKEPGTHWNESDFVSKPFWMGRKASLSPCCEWNRDTSSFKPI